MFQLRHTALGGTGFSEYARSAATGKQTAEC
jgi:hypothetical protein